MVMGLCYRKRIVDTPGYDRFSRVFNPLGAASGHETRRTRLPPW